ncbi:GntR family transcriptional regulator [Labrys okinawensis]|uniref:GntR family transcriptional regulator n=1 Tax=Labrys okinawensis TaxID=346911 RepID=UPI0039BCADF4
MDELISDSGPAFNVPDIIAKELSRFLEDQIIFGELPPGSRLVEEDIVKRHKVSRSPVREALRSLEQEGLAIRESRRGVWVSEMSIDDLNDVYACRLNLEALATEMAAERRTDQDLVDIRAALEALEASIESSDLREFFRYNLALSARIHAATHNKTLGKLLSTIGKQSYRYRILAYSHFPEMMRASVEGHKEVLSAIEKRNKNYARTLMEDMIQKSWASIQTFLKHEHS